MHLGAVDAQLHAARCVLEQAAYALDAGTLAGADGWRAALRVREVVALAAEDVLRRAAHGLGPGPLATDEEHARRVADLELYLRQWHAERDQAAARRGAPGGRSRPGGERARLPPRPGRHARRLVDGRRRGPSRPCTSRTRAPASSSSAPTPTTRPSARAA